MGNMAWDVPSLVCDSRSGREAARFVRSPEDGCGQDGRPGAVDGKDAAGETTLADRLASALVGGPHKVIRVGVDGWHNPEEIGYRRGSLSPEGYYLDSFDLYHLRRELLDPLGPTGSHAFRLARVRLPEGQKCR